ncbi:MAG: OB-fold nucleic acid binding domain-containing protein [Candidatus Hadarchaeum sp.]|uniref:OB-fold nucleic acid binding domain-containing protein n=1 Tax=Candidatus Hadarchaeum sp. TaxID=2883567 RepID=UPI003D149888
MKIEDIVLGRYIRSPDGTQPSFLLTPWGEQVTRVRVMGTLVDKFIREDQNYATLRIDDGSETISLRAWQEGAKEFDKFNLGDTVDVIGRVREFQGEIYLTPELLIRVEDLNWELVRELEIIATRREAIAAGVRPKFARLEPKELKITATQEVGTEAAEAEEEPLPVVPDELKKKVAIAIDKLDTGSGVEPIKIANELNLSLSQVNDILRVMFVEGDVFEPTAGKFRLAR